MTKDRRGTKEWFEEQFDVKDVERLGDKWGHRWRGSQKFRHKLSLKMVQDLLKQNNDLKILDIGCGLGEFTSKLYQLNPRNQIFGIDISQRAVEYLSQKFPWLQAKQGELPSIPFPNNSFDLVVALEVLYYLDSENREKALSEIKRVLKEGGFFLMSGVLDGGVRYFDEAAIKDTLAKEFVIKKIKYNYAKYYTKYERMLLKLISIFEIIYKYSKPDNKIEEAILFGKLQGRKILLFKTVRFINKVTVLRNLIRVISGHAVSALHSILSSETFPAIITNLSKYIAKQRSKSHILVLCQKVIHDE